MLIMRFSTMVGLSLFTAVAVGCGADDAGAANGNDSGLPPGSTPETSTSGDGASDGTPTPDAQDSGDETADSMDDGGFVPDPDTPQAIQCDVWEQDCPEGEKCAHYSIGAPGGNGNRCVPVVDNPGQEGDLCDGTQIGEGIDDCDLGHYCSFINDEGQGVCIAMCSGNEAAPLCPDGTTCAIDNEGTLISCTQDCDPVLQDCAAEIAICMPATGFDGFNCATGWGDGAFAQGDACEYSNSCAPGLFCNYNPASLNDCQGGTGCCSPYCDMTLNAPDGTNPACADMGPGVLCNSWYAGDPPPSLEHVGGCWIPE